MKPKKFFVDLFAGCGGLSLGLENVEYFYYKKVIHTKSPFVSNFQTLCNEGIITLDHLIKRDEKGKVAEKGPLFKINEKNLELLFPPPRVFDLTKNL